MVPKRYDVTEETAAEWLRRSQQKESFSQLSRVYRVERRTIAKTVRRLEIRQQEDRGISARGQLVAEFLREHLEETEVAAHYLLEIMAEDALGGRLPTGERSVESMLIDKLRGRFMPGKPQESTVAANVDVTSSNLRKRVEERLAERRARATVQGLQAHLPEAWALTQAWEEERRQCAQQWKKLQQQADRTGISSRLLEAGVKTALQELFEGDQQVGKVRYTVKIRKDGDSAGVNNLLLANPAARTTLMELRSRLRRFQHLYEQIEDKFAFPSLRKTLLATRCVSCPET